MIIDKIRAFLTQSPEFKSRLPEVLNDKDSLIDSGIIDSFGIISLISFLEPAFGIKIASEDLAQENFESLVSLERFINEKLAQKPK